MPSSTAYFLDAHPASNDALFRPVVLARELTKLHEEIFRGTLADAVARYGGGDGNADSGGGSGAAAANSGGVVKDPRGEFTVILGPRAATSAGEGGAEGAARAMAALEARWVTMFRREGRAHWTRGGIDRGAEGHRSSA